MPSKQYIKKLNGFYIKDEEARSSIEEINEDIEVIEDKNTHVQYIFPQNWGFARSGDISLIKAYGKNILIDTHRPGNKIDVYDFLDRHNVSHIDYMIISHYHIDHMGNVANLINDNYVDRDTVVYIPQNCDMIEADENLRAYRSEVLTALEGANISYHIPEELEAIEIGADFKLVFFNTNADAMNTWVNYNNCSTICMITHGNNKVLYTGDALGSALNRARREGFISEHVNLYKIEHHGIEYGNTIPLVLEEILPDFAIQPSSMGDAQISNYSVSTTIGLLQSFGTKIYSCHSNDNDIVFESTLTDFSVKQGKQSVSVSNNRELIKSIFVDANTTNSKQDGTQDYPFKDLSQAIGAAENLQAGIIRVYLGAGSYGVWDPPSEKPVPHFRNLHLQIRSRSENPSDTYIETGLHFSVSNVEIENCTIRATDINKTAVSASYSKVHLKNCVVEDVTTEQDGTALWSEKSEINLESCSFVGFSIAISTHNDEVFSYESTFSNTGTAFYMRGSRLSEKSSTFNEVVTKRVLNTGSIEERTRRIPLWTGTQISGDIELSDDVRKYKKLVIITGAVSAGTAMGSELYPYNDQNFLLSGSYNFPTYEGLKNIAFSQSGRVATITSSAANPSIAVRGIYGVEEEV